MTYLFDTDTCIGVLRQRSGMVQRLSQLAPTDCAVSMVTVYELFCGLAKAQDPAKERQKVERFISAVIELPLDRASAEAAAKVRGELGAPRQPHWAVRSAHCGPGVGRRAYACYQQPWRVPARQWTELAIVAVGC